MDNDESRLKQSDGLSNLNVFDAPGLCRRGNRSWGDGGLPNPGVPVVPPPPVYPDYDRSAVDVTLRVSWIDTVTFVPDGAAALAMNWQTYLLWNWYPHKVNDPLDYSWYMPNVDPTAGMIQQFTLGIGGTRPFKSLFKRNVTNNFGTGGAAVWNEGVVTSYFKTHLLLYSSASDTSYYTCRQRYFDLASVVDNTSNQLTDTPLAFSIGSAWKNYPPAALSIDTPGGYPVAQKMWLFGASASDPAFPSFPYYGTGWTVQNIKYDTGYTYSISTAYKVETYLRAKNTDDDTWIATGVDKSLVL